MTRKKDPPHPGKILRDEILPELGITLSEAARQLGIYRVKLWRFLNGQYSVSADFALRLSLWLGQDAHYWMRMQAEYDLGQVLKAGIPRIEKIETKGQNAGKGGRMQAEQAAA